MTKFIFRVACGFVSWFICSRVEEFKSSRVLNFVNLSTYQHISTSTYQHISTSTNQHISTSTNQPIIPSTQKPTKKTLAQLLQLFYFCTALSNRGVVQLASILAWGASGRPFESGRSDKNPSSKSGEGFFNS